MADTEKNKETAETRKATEPVLEQPSVEEAAELHKDQTPLLLGYKSIAIIHPQAFYKQFHIVLN